jgi:hypothetical protein
VPGVVTSILDSEPARGDLAELSSPLRPLAFASFLSAAFNPSSFALGGLHVRRLCPHPLFFTLLVCIFLQIAGHGVITLLLPGKIGQGKEIIGTKGGPPLSWSRLFSSSPADAGPPIQL